jgi:hypothetical protein
VIGTLAGLIGFNQVQGEIGPSVVEGKEVTQAVAQDDEATVILSV